MIRRVVAIPHSANVLEACEFFVLHKFFAFPIIDDQRHMVGLVDVTLSPAKCSTWRRGSSAAPL